MTRAWTVGMIPTFEGTDDTRTVVRSRIAITIATNSSSAFIVPPSRGLGGIGRVVAT